MSMHPLSTTVTNLKLI